MHDFLQPYLNDVVQSVVGLLFAVLVAAVVKLRHKVESYYVAHTNASQRDVLHVIAGEAVAYVGTVFKDQDGQKRLESALTYVNTRLKPLGISFTVEELRGSVEKAYAEYKTKTQVITTSEPIQAISAPTTDTQQPVAPTS